MNRRIILRRMLKSPFFVVGLIGVLFVVVVCLLAPVITDFSPISNSLTSRFAAPELFTKSFSGHVLGTDNLGRDVFARLLYGGRYSLMIAAFAVVFQVIIGSVLGIIAGYFGGFLNTIIMRICDVILAIPNLILAIAMVAVLGATIPNLIVVLTISGWVQCCRVTRNAVMVVKTQEFIKASQALGATGSHIMFQQILANVTTNIIILGSQNFGMMVLVEAGLSFLSFGVQPPTPSWGNMIATGRNYMTTYPWMVFAPGIAMMITVLAFNMFGDGLRDVLDPKQIR